MDSIGPAALMRLLTSARAEFALVESTLNTLNVFPVPDGDTGTNLRATMDAALAPLSGGDALDPATASDELLRALTVGGQGNSGVILAQYIRGLIESEPWRTHYTLDPDGLVVALRSAADLARQAVDRPVEGTILSVADAAAAAAERARAAGADLAAITSATWQAAVDCVKNTTGNLGVLAEAGVIDAGGAGLAILFECLDRIVNGRYGLPAASTRDWLKASSSVSLARDGACHVAAEGPGFEFMSVAEGLSEQDAAQLRSALTELGDSVVVAGGRGVYRVHVHTDDVLAAATQVRSRARLSAPSVTRFAGELTGMHTTLVLTLDEVLMSLASALGAQTVLPADEDERAALEVLLVDSTVEIPAELTEKVRGVRASLHVALELEALAFDAAWGGETTGEAALPIYRADSWRAARDMVVTRFAECETAFLAVSDTADARHLQELLESFADHTDVTVLRLTSGYLVQLAGE